MPLLGGRSAKFGVVVVTGCMLDWGVDLPLDLPIWALTIEILNCHSLPLDASTGGELSNPRNCQFWPHSCIWLEELPPNVVSHPYLIFRNKWDIQHFLFFLTFSYHWEILYEPHCQQCWVKFLHASHVILQLILYKLWRKMLLWAFQPYKLPILTSHLHLTWKATPKYGVTSLHYL